MIKYKYLTTFMILILITIATSCEKIYTMGELKIATPLDIPVPEEIVPIASIDINVTNFNGSAPDPNLEYRYVPSDKLEISGVVHYEIQLDEYGQPLPEVIDSDVRLSIPEYDIARIDSDGYITILPDIAFGSQFTIVATPNKDTNNPVEREFVVDGRRGATWKAQRNNSDTKYFFSFAKEGYDTIYYIITMNDVIMQEGYMFYTISIDTITEETLSLTGSTGEIYLKGGPYNVNGANFFVHDTEQDHDTNVQIFYFISWDFLDIDK